VRARSDISEPRYDELPNRSEAQTSKLILNAPPAGCKLEVGGRVLSPLYSIFSAVGVDACFMYAAVAGEARPTAAMNAGYLAAGECTGMRRSGIVKAPREKGLTGKPKTAAVIESVKSS
jgi:hypothetical protein